jgi:hypothetical protein
VRGPNSDFATNGWYDDPVHGGTPVTTAGDFWPGYYSKTHGALVVRYQHAERIGGRAVVFPGAERLVGRITVGAVLAWSAIGGISVLGGAPAPDPGVELDTRDFVRPLWMNGRLTLMALPAPGGRIAPFELPNPIPCCADH